MKIRVYGLALAVLFLQLIVGKVNAQGNGVYVTLSTGVLVWINVDSCTTKIIGPTTVSGTVKVMTDIALCPNGVMYGTDGSNLYSINLSTGVSTLIGSMIAGQFIQSYSALVCDKNNQLFTASGVDNNLWQVNPATGATTNLGGMGYNSAGDLTFYNDTLYLASSNNKLVRVNQTNLASSQLVGTMNSTSSVYGVVTVEKFDCVHPSKEMLATADKSIYDCNPYTAVLTPKCTNVVTDPIYGATSPAENKNPCPFTVATTGGSVCPGSCVTITATPSSGTAPFSYSWSPGGATSSSVKVCPNATTIYTVTVTDANHITATSTATATISPSPTATVTPPSTICAGSSATLTAGGGGTYSWSTGQTSASIVVNPSSSSSYSVWVSNASGCKDSTNTTVTINPAVKPSVTPAVICKGDVATINASGGTGYSWNTGSTGSSIMVSPTVTTSYTVLVTAGTCSATAIATVTVSSGITASITGAASICTGSSATLTASGGSTFSWAGGSTSPVLVVTPTSSSTYSVWAYSGTCKDSTSINVTVNPIPTPSVTSSTICAGQPATLMASGGGSYSWSNNQTSSSITVSPSASTSYTVTVTSNGCSASAAGSVAVNPIPTPSVSSSTICMGDAATLTATGGGTYSWSTGDLSSSITVNPVNTSFYTVTVTNSSNCTAAATATVAVASPPVAGISGINTICQGSFTTLTATGGGTYAWNTGSNSASIVVNPASTSTYSVIVSVGSCSDTAYYSVTVNPIPAPSISGNNQLCQGQSTTLTATGGGIYSWSNGSASSSIVVSPAATGTTSYTVTVTQNGCTATATATVTVSPQPVPASASYIICSGDKQPLSASGGTTYLWSTGETSSSITVSPTATATATATNYSVLVSVGSCTAISTYSVHAVATPTATAQGDTTIGIGDAATLTASGGSAYSWAPAIGLSCINCANPVASPQATTRYCVFIANGSCTDTACVQVVVEFNCKPIYVPNAFSPNGDGDNDILYVYGNCIRDMKFIIYNRWGEKVYEGTNPKEGWDGTFNGKPENTAVFAYYLEYTLVTGTSGSKKGNVSLVR